MNTQSKIKWAIASTLLISFSSFAAADGIDYSLRGANCTVIRQFIRNNQRTSEVHRIHIENAEINFNFGPNSLDGGPYANVFVGRHPEGMHGFVTSFHTSGLGTSAARITSARNRTHRREAEGGVLSYIIDLSAETSNRRSSIEIQGRMLKLYARRVSSTEYNPRVNGTEEYAECTFPQNIDIRRLSAVANAFQLPNERNVAHDNSPRSTSPADRRTAGSTRNIRHGVRGE